MSEKTSPTISTYLNAWLSLRKSSKSYNTFLACRSAARVFLSAVGNIPLASLNENHYSMFLTALKRYDARTEQLYATLIFGWIEYLDAKDIKSLNISKIKYARKNEQRQPGEKLRPFDGTAIARLQKALLGWVVGGKDLRMARARALVCLAMDSGLRVSEICKLTQKNIDLDDLTGTVVGKRNKERIFYFTKPTAGSIRLYINMRTRLEPDRGKDLPPGSVPLFVSHSKRSHSKLIPLDTDTARKDLANMVKWIIAGETKSPITPHVLRHYAGNQMRKATGDIEIVRILLGQKNINTTKGYMHADGEEVERAYRKHFGDKK